MRAIIVDARSHLNMLNTEYNILLICQRDLGHIYLWILSWIYQSEMVILIS